MTICCSKTRRGSSLSDFITISEKRDEHAVNERGDNSVKINPLSYRQLCLVRYQTKAYHHLISSALASLSLAIMSSPPPKKKQKHSQKLSRLLKPSKQVAGASAASSHSTPVSSSPSHSLTHAARHAMDTGRTITPEALGMHIGSTKIQPLCPQLSAIMQAHPPVEIRHFSQV